MKIDRAAIIAGALETLEVGVWRTTRYANDTGTCLWCQSGALVMVPDDAQMEWFCQAKGGEALFEKLSPLVEPLLAEAAEKATIVAESRAAGLAAMSPAQRALLDLGEQLRREGYDEAIAEARLMFANIMQSKFGQLPPTVRARIDQAQFYQLQRWSQRIFSMPRAILVVA